MNIIKYELDEHIYFGVLEGNQIRRIQGSIFGAYEIEQQLIVLDEVRLLAPVSPSKMIALGIFLVSPTAVIGSQDAISLKFPEHRTEHEGELAIVLGKQAECVTAAESLDYVLGYTCCNDVSDRVLQKKDRQFTRAKSFATYKPLGPAIVTGLNPDQVAIKVTVNGEVRQHSHTSDMIFSVSQIVSFVSTNTVA